MFVSSMGTNGSQKWPIRWTGRVFQHFKMQISQLLLCDGSCVSGSGVLQKQHSFWQVPPPFGDQRLLHFFQDRWASCDCCTLFEVANQQYPIFDPENRCYHLGGYISVFEAFWVRWSTVSSLLGLFLCIWIIQMYPFHLLS